MNVICLFHTSLVTTISYEFIPASVCIWSQLLPSPFRNNDWPTSLGGKAYDTAIVLSWLGEFMNSDDCDLSQLPEDLADIWGVARYTVACANGFFRICRKSGIFLQGDLRSTALQCGMDMNETWLVASIVH